jgi:hypothetical protein
MPRALRNDDAIVGLHPVTYAIDPDLAFAALNAKELIAIIVNFFADLITGLDRHEDKLNVVAGVENAPEVVVVLSPLFDVVNKTFHNGLYI